VQFSALKQELSDRGFDELSDTRLGQFINQGRAELDNLYSWPYRLTSASGASPLTINDLGTIEEVANSAVSGSPPLDYADRRTLRDYYGDITITGTPSFFYIDNGVVRTYPVGGTLAVRYYKRPPLLTAAGDTPLAPVDYHLLYVDFAARWAAKDGMQPDGLSADILRQVQIMVADLFGQQLVGSDLAPVTGDSCDW
jgi:hypothetical protein